DLDDRRHLARGNDAFGKVTFFNFGQFRRINLGAASSGCHQSDYTNQYQQERRSDPYKTFLLFIFAVSVCHRSLLLSPVLKYAAQFNFVPKSRKLFFGRPELLSLDLGTRKRKAGKSVRRRDLSIRISVLKRVAADTSD